MINSVAIIGDLHYSTGVRSRTDDVKDTCIKKLTQLADNYDALIFLGDMFEKPSMQFSYLIPLYQFFAQLKRNNKLVLSIMGNHDIYNERENSLYGTSLGWLDITHVIHVIKPDEKYYIQIGNTKYCLHTTYVDLQKAHQHLPNIQLDSECENILLAHHYFEDEHPGLELHEINKFKAVFLGHQHNPFGVCEKDGVKIYRSGAILRNTADSYNLNRTPYCFGIQNSGGVNTIHAYQLDDVIPGDKVFTPDAYQQTNLNRKRYINFIEDIVNKCATKVSNESKFSVKSAMLELGAPQSAIDYIANKYMMAGERFE